MENIYHDYWQQELMYQFLVEDKCKKKAYVCSPYSAENNEGMLQNMRTARAYMFYALKKMGMCARAPHAFLPMLLCDSVPSERAIALKFGIELLERSDVLLVCGNRISNGMKSEIANAAMLRMPIIVQTIGRIRRMPEARHYGSDLLDSCYLYTFDEKFTAGVKMSLGKGALDACTLFLKNEFKEITLTSEQRTSVTTTRNPQKALLAVAKYAEKHYGVGTNETENKTRLQAAGYVFSDDIVRYTVSGETATLDFSAGDLNAVAVTEKLNTHTHGRDYHNRIGKIGLEIGMEYSYMNTIIRKLFDANFTYNRKILALEPRQVYSFVLNNADRLRHLVREAMAAELAQMELDFADVTTFEFRIPQSCMFTYDGGAKTQLVMEKNVYQGYLSSAEPRSTPERKFEKFCERTPSVDWFYKNGDKGNEYLSIVYQDNSGKQKLFYPDYVISVKGKLWIIETKGGFDRSGNSQDIDMFTPKKFEVLKKYLDKYGLKGGIVRNDEHSDELCICTDNYSDDINSDEWKLLEETLR